MEIEKLIKHMREEAQDYRSGRTLGRAFADAEDVLDEAATALEHLQAENDRLRRERDDAIRQLKFFAPCAGCKWYRGIKGCAHELVSTTGKHILFPGDTTITCKSADRCHWAIMEAIGKMEEEQRKGGECYE